jgi:hypothetical protein
MGKVFNLKFCLYLQRLDLGSSPLHEAAGRYASLYDKRYAESKKTKSVSEFLK